MAKAHITYKCTNCDNRSPVKIGRCNQCWEFGTFEPVADENNSGFVKTKSTQKATANQSNVAPLERKDYSHILNWDTTKKSSKEQMYFDLGEKEMKRVFNKDFGIRKGWVYLLWWEPGIWKSTMMLQIVKNTKWWAKFWYFSGEENEEQVSERALRLGIKDFDVYNASDIDQIFATILKHEYNFIIIDSIQTVYSGSIEGWAKTQLQAAAEMITAFCKQHNITGIIIGHVTKGGELWGPKYLEHIVDAVMYLEGDRYGSYRFLRSKKNRFASADEVGIFEMTEQGLKPVHDYKQRILDEFEWQVWNTLAIGIDNGRPFLVSVEVLITESQNSFPQRNVIWYDRERLHLLIAILDKYVWCSALKEKDIFLNIPGEVKYKDNGLDLAIAVALYGALMNKSYKSHIFVWELTLMWKLQKTSYHNKRLKEIQEDWGDSSIIDMSKYKTVKELLKTVR